MEENGQIWDDAERSFWVRFRRQRDREEAEVHAEHQVAVKEAQIESETLEAKRVQAVKARDRLLQQLEDAEKNLALVAKRCQEKADRLKTIENDFLHNERERLERQESIKRSMSRWFHKKRGREVSPSIQDGESEQEEQPLPQSHISTQEASLKNASGKRPWRPSTQASVQSSPTRPSPDRRSSAEPSPTEPIHQRPSKRSCRPPPEDPVSESDSDSNSDDHASGGPNSDDDNDDKGNNAHQKHTESKDGGFNPSGVSHQSQPSKQNVSINRLSSSTVAAGEAMTTIQDAAGKIIGPLRRVEPWNPWQQALLDMPVKRVVGIRPGRQFDRNSLEGIYKRIENKGLKWIACMIQATGEIKSKPCAGCKKGRGPFAGCVFVESELFPKCGNCEWNRQGCHGAVLHKMESADAVEDPGANSASSAHEARRTHEKDNQVVQSIEFAAEEKTLEDEHSRKSEQGAEKETQRGREHGKEHESGQTSQEESESDDEHKGDQEIREEGHDEFGLEEDQEATYQQSKPPETQKRPEQRQQDAPSPTPGPGGMQSHHQSTSRGPSLTVRIIDLGNDTDLADYSPSSSPLTPLAPDMSPPRWTLPGESDHVEIDLTPITRANLVLKHNGSVYTYPEIMAGVPLEKIDKNHPYWEPTWQDVRVPTQQTLDRWLERVEQEKKARERGEETHHSQRWYLGRQVNRGLRILDYLDKGEISPYQLLAKRYVLSSKGSITAYDTLFRLCETLLELDKFQLDVRPLEWVRHRLHEIWLEQGKAFNMCRAVRHFYNDPKLAALRANAGFKNIGRPSAGIRAERAGRGGIGGVGIGVGASPLMDSPCRQQSPGSKRKEIMHSPAATPLAKRPHLSIDTVLDPTAASASTSRKSTPREPFAKTLQHHHQESQPQQQQQQEQQKQQEQQEQEKQRKQKQPVTPTNKSRPPPNSQAHSDTDSYSGGSISSADFRVSQVKSRLYTSSASVTQYMHFFEAERRFEHQVLKEVRPVLWGNLRQPIDFNVLLHDIAGLSYNAEALRAELAIRKDSRKIYQKDGLPQGNLLIKFKRGSTLERFVACLRLQGIPITVLDEQVMLNKWDTLNSEQLPDTDAEASKEFVD